MTCSHPGRDQRKSILKMSTCNIWVKVWGMEREEELSIMCIKLMVQGKRGDNRTARSRVHDEHTW